ncbi:neuropeptide CCHamide-1 receptor-like [Portunus trituberculatus]|nr:neuropeptide CCHamide-1 receptor-like [Portunus trituberculatus]XP_045131409.1 neuropeptide CCHamide-1 receptor-like [Portunus trituberculatus]XP_045131410.1 neuropeptide CCHamide-1 receptor-like [Portunus trituberculatus]
MTEAQEVSRAFLGTYSPLVTMEEEAAMDWEASLTTTSSANVSLSYKPYEERPETYIVPVLFVLIFVVGLVGNGTLIAIFVRNRNLRSVPNTYIISLALGDLLVLLFTVPFNMVIYILDSWPFGNFVCKFSELVRDVSVCVTVFTLTALSADRYLAIVSNVRRAAGGVGRRTVRVAVGIWVASGVLALPAALTSGVREFSVGHKNITVCVLFSQDLPLWYSKVYVVTKFLLSYLLPLLVIAIFYLLMAMHLLSADDVPQESHVFHRQLRTRRKVAKIVLTFVLIFAVCLLPTNVFLVWYYVLPYGSYNDFWNAIRIIGFCLCFLNSCINPIALYCISGTFRKYYNHYLSCVLCCCKDGGGTGGTRALLQPSNSAFSRCRSFTMRGTTETITLTTLVQDRPSPATS